MLVDSGGMITSHRNGGMYTQRHTYKNAETVKGLGHSLKCIPICVMSTDWEGTFNDWGDNMLA